MTIDEIRSAMLDLTTKAKNEARGLTAEEQSKFDALDAQKRTLQANEALEAEQRAVKMNAKVNAEQREFSLVRAINDVIANRGFEESEARAVEQGRKSFDGCSVRSAGQIVMPVEQRAAVTASGAADAIGKDVASALDPLYYAEAFNALGVTRMSNLKGDLAIPAYAGASVGWATETGAAADGTGAVTAKKFTPHRLTAKVVLSKQFLLQDISGVEAIVRRDLFTAVSHKLQSTVFGTTAASNSPAGVLNGIIAETTDLTYAKLLALESKLETNKLMYNPKYLLSIEAKAQLRGIGVGTSTTQFGLAYQDGKVLGTDAVTTGDVATKGIILADWAEFVVAQWGGLDITVDPYTLAANGQIQLVVNAYFDAGFRRDNAFAAAVLK